MSEVGDQHERDARKVNFQSFSLVLDREDFVVVGRNVAASWKAKTANKNSENNTHLLERIVMP